MLAYDPPKLTAFSAERCTEDGSAAQMDGTRVRITASATASPVGNKNDMACTVYYRTRGAEAWATAQNLIPLSYSIGVTNALLPQTFDVLSSYELKIRVADTFYYAEQSVEIGTKQVMIDLYQHGTGIAFGKVAETPGAVEFGWPIQPTEPLEVTQGGTGANNGASACANIGAVQKSGDAMTGTLQISGRLYPSLYLLPTYNGTTNRVVFEGSCSGAGSFAAWEDSSGTNRRMLEVSGHGQVQSQQGRRGGAALRGAQQLLQLPPVPRGHGDAGSHRQRRHGREYGEGGTDKSGRVLRRDAAAAWAWTGKSALSPCKEGT